LQLVLIVPSIALGWLITFALMFAIGALGFFMTKTMAVANTYFGLYVPLSGYLMPLAMMEQKQRWVATIAHYTPFPSMLSTPVLMMTHTYPADRLAWMLGTQAGWAVAAIATALGVWRLGVRRFEAVGA
jgi:ABC-2 type transport system permease protein